MLSYRHAFHAGNLADVLKHSVLTTVLGAALRKPTPLIYLDSHAGAGRYDLNTSDVDAEYHAGIGALHALHLDAVPAGISKYLECVAAQNSSATIRHYPGSPAIAAMLLRDIDRLVLAERHPADYTRLLQTLGHDRRVQIDSEDGYTLLKSTLPPLERRGLVLIDPAYERSDEPVRLSNGLRAALSRFRHGVYVVWYPLQSKHDPASLKRHLRKLGPPKTLCIELDPRQSGTPGAIASGVLVINPPHLAVAELEALTEFLGRKLLPGGSATCAWMVPE